MNRTLFRDGFNYFLSKIIPGGAGLLSVIVFVRMVGYAEYGRFAVLFATAMAFALGLSGWLGQGTLRFQSKYHTPADSASFQHATRFGALLSAVLGGLALAISLWLSDGYSLWSLVLSVGFFAVALAYNIVYAQLQASLRSQSVLVFESIRSVGSFSFSLLLVVALSKTDHRLLLLGVLLGHLLPLLLHAIFERRRAKLTFDSPRLALPRREGALLGEVWHYGWPVGLWLFCQQGLVVSDRFFIQKFAGYSAAGIYASMYDLIVRSFSLVFAPITLAVHPLIMRHWNLGETSRAIQAIRSGLRWQLSMFLPIAALLLAASPWLVHMALGQANQEAASIVLPLALGGFFWSAALLAHKPLEILCRTNRMLVGIFIALVINVAGNWLFVPRYGYRAAAYVTIASASAYLLMLAVLTPRRELHTSASAGLTAVQERAQSNSSEPVMTSPS